MKWLIYGWNGWIGTQIIHHLQQLENEEVVCAESRADDEVSVEIELTTILPDRVLCVIGRTHGEGFSTIDYLEQKGKLLENVRDNLYAPMVLTLLCHKYKIHLTYLGTGCIFSDLGGEKEYTEQDKPDFFGSSYSIVKGFTDRLMHFFEDTVLNVRIRMPIVGEHHPRNFITKITSYDNICSIPNSMTNLDDMIPILIDMARHNLKGTINLTNPDPIEHNEILSMYQTFVDPEFTWKNFSIEEQKKILLSERSNNTLDTSLLQKLYPDVPDIRTSLLMLFQNWR